MTKTNDNLWTYLRLLALLIKALVRTRGGLAEAAESMFLLNRYARSTDDREQKEWVYDLKSRLVQALYEGGYCTAVGMTTQTQPCWGTWNYDCGPDCPKCGGTGIYRQTELYDFTFLLGGRSYRWHQPASLVKWKVKLDALSWRPYEEREKEGIELNFWQLQYHAFVVWWALKIHGRAPRMPLFNPFRIWRWQSEGFYGDPGQAYALFFLLDWDDHGWRLQWPVVWGWLPGSVGLNGYWAPRWFILARGRYASGGKLRLLLFGVKFTRWFIRTRKRATCFVLGHDWYCRSDGRGYCGRCFRSNE